MFDLNLQNALKKDRDRRISSQDLKAIVQRIFDQKEASKAQIKSKLDKKNTAYQNSITFDDLDVDRIFHIDSIEKLCISTALDFWTPICLRGTTPMNYIASFPN